MRLKKKEKLKTEETSDKKIEILNRSPSLTRQKYLNEI
jgi:hypothetical protein